MSTPNTYLGIDLGGTRTKVGLVNRDGRITRQKVFPTNAPEGYELWLKELWGTIRGWPLDQSTKAVGLAVPVSVDWKTRKLMDCEPNLPGWDGSNLAAALEQKLELPVHLEIDANAEVLAEHAVGLAQGLNDFIVVTLGTGVGSGVFSGGRLVRGFQGLPCVLGHVSICHDGPSCPCGSRGCLELYICASAVLARATKLAGHPIDSVEEIVEAGKQNRPWHRELIQETGYYLGVGLANMVHAFNPQMIILSGGLSNLGPGLRQAAWEVLKSRVYKGFLQGLCLEISGLGGTAGIVGAAMAAMTPAHCPKSHQNHKLLM